MAKPKEEWPLELYVLVWRFAHLTPAAYREVIATGRRMLELHEGLATPLSVDQRAAAHQLLNEYYRHGRQLLGVEPVASS